MALNSQSQVQESSIDDDPISGVRECLCVTGQVHERCLGGGVGTLVVLLVYEPPRRKERKVSYFFS